MLWKWDCLCNDSLFNGSFAKNWLCCAVSKRVRHKGSGRHSHHNLKSHYQIFVEVDSVFQKSVFHCCQKDPFCTYQKGQSHENWWLPSIYCSSVPVWQLGLSLICSGCIAWVALGPDGFSPWETTFVVPTGICVMCPGLGVWGLCCTLTLVCKHSKRVQHVWLSWAELVVAKFLLCRVGGSCQMAANHP